MKLFAATFCALFFATLASAQALDEDCDCGHNPYVMYELSHPVEMDENPWLVESVERFDHDLTREDEPEVCVVWLELIPHTEELLYQDIQQVPEGDQELLWNGHWVLMSQFENQMNASGCSTEAQS